MSWQRGDRVWYSPSEGVQFAGVVLGEGSCAGSVRLFLSGHYFQWKWAASAWAAKPEFAHGELPAVSEDALTIRESYLQLDSETPVELARQCSAVARANKLDEQVSALLPPGYGVRRQPVARSRCPGCGSPALDGHITCGLVECDERGRR